MKPEQLKEFIKTVYYIQCSKCDNELDAYGNIKTAAKFFYSNGWRVVDGKVCCNEHSKK